MLTRDNGFSCWWYGNFRSPVLDESSSATILPICIGTKKAEDAFVKKKCQELSCVAKNESWDYQKTVRFVEVGLSAGEIEVLVTSLLDGKKYLALRFFQLYKEQRGVEGCVIKERVSLSNFAGKTNLS